MVEVSREMSYLLQIVAQTKADSFDERFLEAPIDEEHCVDVFLALLPAEAARHSADITR